MDCHAARIRFEGNQTVLPAARAELQSLPGLQVELIHPATPSPMKNLGSAEHMLFATCLARAKPVRQGCYWTKLRRGVDGAGPIDEFGSSETRAKCSLGEISIDGSPKPNPSS